MLSKSIIYKSIILNYFRSHLITNADTIAEIRQIPIQFEARPPLKKKIKVKQASGKMKDVEIELEFPPEEDDEKVVQLRERIHKHEKNKAHLIEMEKAEKLKEERARKQNEQKVDFSKIAFDFDGSVFETSHVN